MGVLLRLAAVVTFFGSLGLVGAWLLDRMDVMGPCLVIAALAALLLRVGNK